MNRKFKNYEILQPGGVVSLQQTENALHIKFERSKVIIYFELANVIRLLQKIRFVHA